MTQPPPHFHAPPGSGDFLPSWLCRDTGHVYVAVLIQLAMDEYPGYDLAAVQEHIDTCDHCSEEYERFRRTAKLFKAESDEKSPLAMVQEMLQEKSLANTNVRAAQPPAAARAAQQRLDHPKQPRLTDDPEPSGNDENASGSPGILGAYGGPQLDAQLKAGRDPRRGLSNPYNE